MKIEIDLDNYETMKFSLQNPKRFKEKLIEKLKEYEESAQDSFEADGFEEDKVEAELMRLKIKEIEGINVK